MEPVTKSLWVPGKSDQPNAWRVHQAVRMYDENLAFGRNEETGQWCIFMRQGTTQAASTNDLPILGFNDIPHPDDAITRLRKSDARRRGQEILDELNKYNEDINLERKRRADDAIGQTAEAFEYGFRKMGKHPQSRIFVPGRD